MLIGLIDFLVDQWHVFTQLRRYLSIGFLSCLSALILRMI